MTQPPPGGYPPPGEYPPPPPGFYPPPQGYYSYPPPNVVGVLPTEAYTPWISRVGASLIDAIPIFVLYGIGMVMFFATGEERCISSGSYDYTSKCTSEPSGVGVIVFLLCVLGMVAFGLWNLYRQGKTGSSIGKSVLKFKVISEKTGQPIGFGMSFVRQLAHYVDSLVCYIGYLFPLWDAKRQTLADKIMSTICVPL
ncbi:putative RDD family membrane protein YckC [Mycolicibacterium sp. BK556]|uniref:RDD family protein n=1 Tax=unclassified Mycolicibacterium TaxID=2636767 RepID=UPI001620778D|nr:MULTISPECIES: RDD family protein [unclassified Mycolicibacterium]MBB3605616.1 putative RDD family membrane protein YckC [Mycolicibacterium sp. BK556]MBB3635887.1 putative RDD family membrane protein YckC [Mycolicibacterium sp. BK607]